MGLESLQLHVDRSATSGTLFAIASSPHHHESIVSFALAFDGAAVKIVVRCFRFISIRANLYAYVAFLPYVLYGYVHTVLYVLYYVRTVIYLVQAPPKCIRASNSFVLSPEYLSEAREIEFPVSLIVGDPADQPTHAFGYYYPPKACH